MDKKIQRSLDVVAMITSMISFFIYVIISTNFVYNSYEKRTVLTIISIILAMLTGIAVYQNLKAIILAITGAQETIKLLGKPHRGESHYAGPKDSTDA